MSMAAMVAALTVVMSPIAAEAAPVVTNSAAVANESVQVKPMFRKEVYRGPYDSLTSCTIAMNPYRWITKRGCQRHDDGKYWFMTY